MFFIYALGYFSIFRFYVIVLSSVGLYKFSTWVIHIAFNSFLFYMDMIIVLRFYERMKILTIS